MTEANARLVIRDYEPAKHRSQLRSCLVELQDFERRVEPGLPAGEAMADAYLTFLADRCAETSGRIFIAEVEKQVAGFVGVLAKVLPEEPDEDPNSYAYITDAVVLPFYRRRGIGRMLLEHAEGFARASGATSLRVGVLGKNSVADRLYRSLGYSTYHIQLTKKL